MPPDKTKLLRHRWDMHALQALAKRDPNELKRVFSELKDLPELAVDTQVKTFGFGAPMQFRTFGFFDKASAASSSASVALFERVVDGDTMLLLALRQYDPICAIALIKLGASLHVSNSQNENPLQATFDAMAFLRLHPEGVSQDQPENGGNCGLLQLRAEYEALFSVLHDELATFYDKQKADVERGLRELYQRFAPDRVSKIQIQLETYAYREHSLLESAKAKYML
ncbi:hypothetical protein PHYPSEUDO_003290 [Phytophthora pseudosyringae]|uniref:Ankyrin repeat domain-containing protein n=1 Tax=Phytophthora pseudosyringae TaxID=221518 RepID=A0A8T1VRF3_9STRA|nr:hypothetical protein PHYPSEUDO_003290 [Phytophthora pseudosyringae]